MPNKTYTDHRLKYFKADELSFIDSMIPILEAHDLLKESERLSDCGRKYNAFRCTGDDYHEHKEFIFPYRCELRICPRCSMKRGIEVRKQALEIIKQIDKSKVNKFALLTLTKKKSNTDAITPEEVRTFNKHVRKLINTLYPKKMNCGALAITEIGTSFNIHAHVLVYGPYIAQGVLSKEWLRITGDSFIVDVRTAHNQQKAVFYITKYILKVPAFPSNEKYAQFLIALKNVRRLHRYGTFYGVELGKRDPCRCFYCNNSITYKSKVDYTLIDNFRLFWELSKEHNGEVKNGN